MARPLLVIGPQAQYHAQTPVCQWITLNLAESRTVPPIDNHYDLLNGYMKDDAKSKLIELSLLNLNRYDRQIRKLISNVETFHFQPYLTILRIGYFGTADFFLKK